MAIIFLLYITQKADLNKAEHFSETITVQAQSQDAKLGGANFARPPY
jgi:hypothetical protein